jgi:uncharacterized protein (TIGR02996 family)
MKTHEEWVQDLADHPDDLDIPCIYADFLEEQGDAARAYFIRAQCHRERALQAGATAGDVEEALRLWEIAWGYIMQSGALKAAVAEAPERVVRAALERDRSDAPAAPEGAFPTDPTLDLAELAKLCLEITETALLACYGRQWQAVLGRGVNDPQFRRGFVEAARMSARNFIRRGGAVSRLTPLIDVRLTGLGDQMAALARCRHLVRLTCLHLGGEEVDDDMACVLADSPHLARLRELKLDNNLITAAGARVLVASRQLAELRALDLNNNDLGDEGALAYLDHRLGNLEELDLSGNLISRDVRRRLRRQLRPNVRVEF